MCLLSPLPKRNKMLSDAIGNGDKVLADADGKVPDGDQTCNDLTKAMDSAKRALQGRKSILKVPLMPRPLLMPRSRR